jgi:hypothetical protein
MRHIRGAESIRCAGRTPTLRCLILAVGGHGHDAAVLSWLPTHPRPPMYRDLSLELWHIVEYLHIGSTNHTPIGFFVILEERERETDATVEPS